MSGYDTDKSDAQKTIVVEARRKWSFAEKQAAIADAASSSISASARKHAVAASLLFRWRRDAGLAAKRKPKASVAFLPVVTQNAAVALPVAKARDPTGVIEIELSGGHKLRVCGAVDVQTLKHVIAALSGALRV